MLVIDIVICNFAVIKPFSDTLLLAIVLEIKLQSILPVDSVDQKWTHVLEEGAFFTLTEGEAGWHAMNDPGARLYNSSLRNGQISIHLINRLAKFLVRRKVSAKVLLGSPYEFVKRC